MLSERKYSLWYLRQNVLTVPVHLSEPPHSRAGCWCRCAVTGESENLFMAVIYYGTGLLFMIIGNYLPKVKQGAKGRKIVVGNAEKKLFSAFLINYSVFLI